MKWFLSVLIGVMTSIVHASTITDPEVILALQDGKASVTCNGTIASPAIVEESADLDNRLPLSQNNSAGCFHQENGIATLGIYTLKMGPRLPPTPAMITVQGGTLPQTSGLAGQHVATFQIGKYEVTWDEWQEVRTWAVANGYSDLAEGNGTSGSHPVRNVRWYEVVKWSNARSEKEGLMPVYQVRDTVYRTGGSHGNDVVVEVNSEANGYRLPTEAEWEWAARGGSISQGYTYSGSNNLDEVGWYAHNAYNRNIHIDVFIGASHPVGEKAPNELGLYDMSGNVMEWCWSLWNIDYSSELRVIRGGSWGNSAINCTVANRDYRDTPLNNYSALGFRQARNMVEALNSPLINSFSPDQGAPEASVTITGYNLLGATKVLFKGVSANFSVLSDTQIVATVPAGATSGVLTVSSATGTGQSTNWFSVARSPEVSEVTISRQTLRIEERVAGNFTVSASSIPGPLRIAAPTGFEVSLDGVNFAQAQDVVAPLRIDSASNYANGWNNGSNEGSGFLPWNFMKSPSHGFCDVVLASPEDSEITNFGTQAFCLHASPADSGARAYVSRGFVSPLAVGESFRLRWGINWDPNTSSGYNYFSLYSGGAYALTIWQGSYPGAIYISWPGSETVTTGIGYGNQPMTWTFTLLNSSTLRVTATDRNGGSQAVFARDIPVAGSPDTLKYYAYQLDSNIRRRGYFNDLRINSPFEGGGHLPSTLVHVRKVDDGQVNSGNITLSSGGQQLQTLSVSMASQAGNPYDSWVQTHGLDLNGNGDRGADPDSDGHSNLHEFLFGGNPLSGQGTLFSHAMHNGNFVMTFLGRETGGNYSVQSTGNLVSGPWAVELVDAIEAADQSAVPGGYRRLQFVIPVQPGNRFYRLRGGFQE